MPSLFIITGSNGSGKSTIGPTYLPPGLKHLDVFDGDKFFGLKQVEAWKQTGSWKEARNLASDSLFQHFEKISKKALEAREHFAYEGHFTEDVHWNLPKAFKDAGFTLILLFFGLENADVSELRVLTRAKEGGHNVPRFEIERNFYGNLIYTNKYEGLIDDLKILDTTASFHKLLFHRYNGKILSYRPSSKLPNWFSQHLPVLFQQIKKAETDD